MPAGLDTTVPLPVLVTVRACWVSVKVAVTVVAAVTDTVQVLVPEHTPPDHPEKVAPVPGVAVRTTLVPYANEVAQVAPQLMPVGVDVTLPLPVPARLMVRTFCARAKFAVTLVAELTDTVHVPVPEQPPPDQPVNREPDAAVAVSTTLVPYSKEAEHEVPQLMPAGIEVTVPLPAPVLLTASALSWRLNIAVTATFPEVRLTEQVPVPEQPPPDQPSKVDPVVAVAVRTIGLVEKAALHVAPQLIPAVEEETFPAPLPALVTVRVALVQAVPAHTGVGQEHGTPVPH
jgi:hypothetical protein